MQPPDFITEERMAKNKTNAAALRKKRLEKQAKQQKKTDMIAYIIAGIAVAIMLTVLIISFI